MKVVLYLGGDCLHIFLCSSMRDRFETTYRRITRSIILSNAAFVTAWAPPGGTTPANRPLTIGHLSNLTREKGLHLFLDLVKESRKQNLNVRAVIAGPVTNEGDLTTIETAVTELAGALDYLGPIYGEAKDRFYREIDIFVFPTQYVNEAQPTVIFEAMAAGCPVVSYDRGCIRAQIGDHGLVVDQNQDFIPRALTWLKHVEDDTERRGLKSEDIRHEFALRRAEALAVANALLDHTGNGSVNRSG